MVQLLQSQRNLKVFEVWRFAYERYCGRSAVDVVFHGQIGTEDLSDIYSCPSPDEATFRSMAARRRA